MERDLLDFMMRILDGGLDPIEEMELRVEGKIKTYFDLIGKSYKSVKKYVFTGGPCGGKTTALKRLAEDGFWTVPEAVKVALRHKVPLNEIPKVRLILENSIPDFVDVAFCDRGFPDGPAFIRFNKKPVPEELLRTCKENRYDGVFLFDIMSKSKYKQTKYRNNTYDEALKIHELIEESYIEQDYSPIVVPIIPLEERIDFIFEIVGIEKDLS